MSGPDIHDVAALVWPAIKAGSEFGKPPCGAAYPSYTRYGNSFAEIEARRVAMHIIAVMTPPDPAAIARAALEAAAVSCDEVADEYVRDAANYMGGTNPHFHRVQWARQARRHAAAIRALMNDTALAEIVKGVK